jgi:signal transduction histidine kinase
MRISQETLDEIRAVSDANHEAYLEEKADKEALETARSFLIRPDLLGLRFDCQGRTYRLALVDEDDLFKRLP